MKKRLMVLILCTFGFVPAWAEYVQLISTNGQFSGLLTLGTNETARVVSNYGQPGTGLVEVAVDFGAFQITGKLFNAGDGSPVITNLVGPAIIKFKSSVGHHLLGFEVLRSSAPSQPSSTVVIPDDNGAPVQIILESSTDLVTWTAATPGTYGTSTQRRFFRLRAQR